MDKKINQPPDYYYQAYFKTFNLTHFFHKPKIDKIAAMVPPGSTVLDAGCGSGVLLYLLKNKKECKISGIEIRKECVEFARKKCGTDEINVGDLLTLDLSKQFDYITCLDVIEHFGMNDIEKVLSNLDKHLKPGGKLIIAFPTGFYINVVERVWKVIRKILMPGITFDDEEVHNVIPESKILNYLSGKYQVAQRGLTAFWLIRYIVFEKSIII